MKVSDIKDRIKKLYQSFNDLPVRNFLLAIIVNLAVEMLNQRSLFGGFKFMLTRPLQFLYGVLVIMVTVSFSLLFKRRRYMKGFVYLTWVAGALVNFVVKSFRHTPFTAQDFKLIKYALSVAPMYLTGFQMVLIIVLVAALVCQLVIGWIKAKKVDHDINYFKALVVILSFWFGVWAATRLGNNLGFLPKSFGNISDAYKDYGFAYCFSSSLISSGIEKPKDYNEDTINSILIKLEELESGGYKEEPKEDEVPKSTREYPNIIFLQLESLFDPQLLSGLEFSEEVLPNLHGLYKEFPTGLLSVPSVGAGTANTEFEVISGMNLNDFGPGEYPYKTILTHSACESVCFDLKYYGYATHALHNNDGTFYDRSRVFSQLGFDNFTSIEYMNDVEYNELGWADDSILTDEIIGILDSTEGRDYIYAISVQGHGDYPDDYVTKADDITVEGDIDYIPQLTYYVNQIHEMDEFVGELVEALANRNEPVVLVMYGDHLPAFDIEDEDLTEGDTFTTRYVIFNNIGLAKTDRDLEAFQLSSHVLELLKMDGGAISRYHRTFEEHSLEEYLSSLKLLEYDILYGDKEVYGGELPYSQTNMQMGHKNISIDNVVLAEGHIVIIGKNFTPWSRVVINGDEVDAIFTSSSVLLVDEATINPGDTVAVVQKGEDGVTLSSTSLFVYQ